jgi:hypothetical protein
MIQAWIQFWDRREAPTTLALVRILVAAALLGDLLTARLLGLVDAVWAPPPVGVGWGALVNDPPAVVRWLGASAHTAELTYLVAVVSIALVLIGAATQVSAVVFVLASAQLSYLAPDSDRGIDVLLRIAVAVLALSGAHARWSVDAWWRRRRGRPAIDEIPAWPRYLLFAQMIWLYFSAGHNKGDADWGPGGGFSALSIILCDPHYARFDAGWVAGIYPLLQLGTLATMAFEFGAPLMLAFTYWNLTADRPGRLRRWSNRLRLRWLWLAIGVTFHLGIAVTMRLGMFPYGALALYPVFLDPDELSRAWRWLRARTGGTARAGVR